MSILTLAEELLDKGEETKAREIILRHRLAPGQSAMDYVRWAKLCESLAMAAQAVECYNKALSLEKDLPDALYGLGELSYEIGNLYNAKRILRRLLSLIDPSHELAHKAKQILAQVYEELGERGSCEAIKGERSQVPLKETIPTTFYLGERYFPPSLGEKDLEVFLPFLQGRPSFVQVELNPRTGSPLWFQIKRPLTFQDIRDHILGNKYLGCFPIDEKNQVRVVFLSITIPEREWAAQTHQPGWFDRLDSAVLYFSRKALGTTRKFGLPAALEIFRPLSTRLWFFFSEPIHFLWARRFVKALFEKLPYPGEGVVCRPWVLTESVTLGWKENMVELPLGIHPVFRSRSIFVNEDLKPYSNQLDFLKRLRRLSFAEIKDFCRRGELFWKPESNELLDKLCKKCSVINYLVRKAQAGKTLSRNEKLALFLTVGLLDRDGRLLHEVLYSCPDYRFQKIERQRRALPPNPISCYKLREWFPGLTGSYPCDCLFDELNVRYPSPVLHVMPALVPPEEEWFSLKHISPRELAKKYCYYLQEKQRIEEKISIIEGNLKEYFKKHPGKQLEVKPGTYLEYKEGALVLRESGK